MQERTPAPRFEVSCPLCMHQVQIQPSDDEQCQYCGAELKLFTDKQEANQFAEECKAHGDVTQWEAAPGGISWIVGHKSTPPGLRGSGYDGSRGFELGDR